MPIHECQPIAARAEARLAQYGPGLAPEAIAEAAAIEDAMCSGGLDEVLRGVRSAEVVRLAYGKSTPAVVLNVRPEQPLNDHAAVVVCLPIAAVHSDYQRLRAALLGRVLPGQRIVVVANPNGTPNGPRLRDQADRDNVSAGNFASLLNPVLQYLRNTGVKTVSAIGMSFGAELLARLPARAREFGIDVSKLLAIEPPGVRQYSIGNLAIRLAASGWQSRPYVRSGAVSRAYYAALREETNVLHVARAVASPDSMAAAHGISRGGFGEWLDRGLELQPGMEVTIAVGERSLLSPADLVHAVGKVLSQRHSGRVRTISLGPHGHGLIVDAGLTNALAWQVLGPGAPDRQAQAS